ncbi:DUF981 family protein [Flaviflexus massiliensis]|uniref:DUF981 family protein n=1 Tax=Flaviflexus massiliensis TaxID=1522309 RepID=UPI0006D584C4|nr:DUF981 family protein [Flaviflexus massiliensis]
MSNNTILTVAVGAALVGFAIVLRKLVRREAINSEAWAGLFGVTGLITLIIGVHTALVWPYGEGELAYANIEFGEPAVGFGALLLFATVYLWRNRIPAEADPVQTSKELFAALRPAGIFVGFLGIGMIFLAFAWIRFQMGAAPEFEPVSGNFGQWPWLEAIFLAGLWGLVAVGAVLFPFALKNPDGKMMTVVIFTFGLAGVVFALFGALNFYTHIGMNYNLANGTLHRW